MDAVYRTGVHAGGVFGADAGFSDNVCHVLVSLCAFIYSTPGRWRGNEQKPKHTVSAPNGAIQLPLRVRLLRRAAAAGLFRVADCARWAGCARATALVDRGAAFVTRGLLTAGRGGSG